MARPLPAPCTPASAPAPWPAPGSIASHACWQGSPSCPVCPAPGTCRLGPCPQPSKVCGNLHARLFSDLVPDHSLMVSVEVSVFGFFYSVSPLHSLPALNTLGGCILRRHPHPLSSFPAPSSVFYPLWCHLQVSLTLPPPSSLRSHCPSFSSPLIFIFCHSHSLISLHPNFLPTFSLPPSFSLTPHFLFLPSSLSPPLHLHLLCHPPFLTSPFCLLHPFIPLSATPLSSTPAFSHSLHSLSFCLIPSTLSLPFPTPSLLAPPPSPPFLSPSPLLPLSSQFLPLSSLPSLFSFPLLPPLPVLCLWLLPACPAYPGPLREAWVSGLAPPAHHPRSLGGRLGLRPHRAPPTCLADWGSSPLSFLLSLSLSCRFFARSFLSV